jgi:hypothetical protein
MITAWQFCSHALRRMAEMGLDDDKVLDTIRSPHLTYPGSRNHPADVPRTVYVRDNLAVVTSDDGAIITVLWHREEGR